MQEKKNYLGQYRCYFSVLFVLLDTFIDIRLRNINQDNLSELSKRQVCLSRGEIGPAAVHCSPAPD